MFEMGGYERYMVGAAVFMLVIGLVYFFITAIFTSWVASKKGYSGIAWFFLGLFFNILALLAVGFAPYNGQGKP
jgi:hypothetical protein